MAPLVIIAGIVLFLGVAAAGWHYQREAMRRAGSRSWVGWYAGMLGTRDLSSYGWMMARVLPIGFVAGLAFALVYSAFG